jgi:hypothetical protein
MADEQQVHAETGVIYSYKNTAYFVEGNGRNNRMKDPGDANWHPAVRYTQLSGTGEGANLTFTRREDDFLAKFERVEG